MADPAPRAPRPPAGFVRQQYDINGVGTVVYSGGNGKPVVYIHGGGSWHGFDFAQRWVGEHEVFAPSLPGWGASADAPPELDSMAQYQLHLLELFDRMGLEHFDIVGISMGGWIATEFAVSHPKRVRKLVLCCPAGLPSPDYAGPPNLGTTLEDMYGFLVNELKVLDAHLPKTPEEKALHAKEVAREVQSAGRFFSAGGPFDPRLERWLHRVTMPTLLVWSRADRLSPYQRSEKWMKLLPNATLELVDKAGHLVLDESPQALDVVTEFLR
ncbi:MAG: alpha/beta hydrolase [Gammaproteobacteria bacterium]